MDTSVLVAALRSRRGASFRLLGLVGLGRFDIVLSVPLMFEYEEVLVRQGSILELSAEARNDVLDYLCAQAEHREVFYLWRPTLRDPEDDFLLELAVESRCSHIVTHNVRDFDAARRFGIPVVTPRGFLSEIGELP